MVFQPEIGQCYGECIDLPNDCTRDKEHVDPACLPTATTAEILDWEKKCHPNGYFN